MSLLFMDSFDAGDFLAKWSNTAGGDGFSSSTSTPFGVGRSLLRVAATSGVASKLFTPSPVVIVGFWFNYNTVYPSFPAGIMSLRGDANSVDHLTLATGDTANILLVKRGDRNGAILATITNIAYGWHFCEMRATLSDTVGTIEVRIDSVVVASFTGDTKNGGTSSNIDAIAITGSSNNTSINLYFKDIYVLNGSGSRLNNFLGPRRIYTVVATGAGASTALTPSAGANWTCVDELPVSQSDSVSGTPGLKDTYDVSDLPASAAVAEAVQVNVLAKQSDATATSVKPVLRSAGTDYAPSTVALSSVDSTASTIWESDPATAAAWTLAGVNAIQHGVEVA
jgi:hypothetical protein